MKVRSHIRGSRPFAVMMLVALLAAACGQDTESGGGSAGGGAYKVGMAAAVSGPSAECCGTPYVQGARLAIEELNAAGGIGGRQFELDVQDHRGDPTQGALVMQRFASGGVPVVLSAFSQVVAAQAPIAENNDTVLLNPAGSSSGIAKAGANVFTTRAFGERQDQALIQYLMGKGYRTVAIAAIDVERGRDADANWRKLLPPDVKVLDTEFYPQDATDFSTHIAKIRSGHPDAVLLAPQAQDGGVFVKQARAQGVSVPILTTTAFEDQNVRRLAGAAAEGVVYSSMLFDAEKPATPAQQEFVTAYEKRFGQPPNVFSALNYDAVKNVLGPIVQRLADDGKDYSAETLLAAFNDLYRQGFTFDKMILGPGVTSGMELRDLLLPQGIYALHGGGSASVVQVIGVDQLKQMIEG